MPQAYRFRDAAKLTGVSVPTLRRMADSGALPRHCDEAGIQVVVLPDDPTNVRSLMKRPRPPHTGSEDGTPAIVTPFPLDMTQLEQVNALIDLLRMELERKEQLIARLGTELDRKENHLTWALAQVDSLTRGSGAGKVDGP